MTTGYYFVSARRFHEPMHAARTTKGGKVGIALLAGLLVAGVAYLILRPSNPGPSAPTGQGTVTSSTAVAPTATASPEPVVFKFTRPADGSTVVGTFPIEGQAPPLGSDSLWLFDYSFSANAASLVYYRDNDKPIDVQADGSWATTDGPLGGPSDKGASFNIKVVRANPACSQVIMGTSPVPGGTDVIVGKNLPPGCVVVGTLRVVKGD